MELVIVLAKSCKDACRGLVLTHLPVRINGIEYRYAYGPECLLGLTDYKVLKMNNWYEHPNGDDIEKEILKAKALGRIKEIKNESNYHRIKHSI